MILPYMSMMAILINRPSPSVKLYNPALTEDTIRNLKKIGPGISEEKFFKDVDERWTDGWMIDNGC